MDKMSRLLKILNLIQRERKTAKELAMECEVGIRTIYRDIETLENARIPIERNNGFKIGEEYFIPPLAFNQEEAIAVLIALDSYSNSYDPGIMSAKDKIATVLSQRHKNVLENIKDRIVTMEMPRVEYESYEKVITDFRQSIFNCNSVQITYRSISSGERIRLIDPYAMFMREKTWYIIAYCHQREELLLFRLDRIEKHVVQHQSKFTRPANFSVTSYMGNAWNVERGSNEFILLARFSQDVSPLIKNNVFHQTQEITENDDGSITFRARVSGEKEIISWLLSFGPEVQVIEPEHIKDKITEKIHQMLQIYPK